MELAARDQREGAVGIEAVVAAGGAHEPDEAGTRAEREHGPHGVERRQLGRATKAHQSNERRRGEGEAQRAEEGARDNPRERVVVVGVEIRPVVQDIVRGLQPEALLHLVVRAHGHVPEGEQHDG